MRHPMIVDDSILPLDEGRFGLLTAPSGTSRAAAVVLLNAGSLHRAGPFRLHVLLARALAEAGYVVLRFDLPGIGDAMASASRPHVDTVRAALDRLVAVCPVRKIVVGGICSAADLGWKAALVDDRIAGLLMLDGLARQGAWFQFERIARLLANPPRLLAALRRRAGSTASAGARITQEDIRDWPAPGTERGEFAQIVQRGVEVLAAYTGEAANYALHRRQFRSTLGAPAFAPNVRYVEWPRADHLFCNPVDRAEAIVAIRDWLTERIPQWRGD
jgi:dienelactone hydrolase